LRNKPEATNQNRVK